MTTDPNRFPLYSREAERSVLGSMLRDNLCIADVIPLLRDIDFHLDAHQHVWRAVCGLYDAGQPADLVTVAEWLQGHARVQEVGYPLLGELWDAAPTAANAVYYAEIVRDFSLKRRLFHTASEVASMAQDNCGPADQTLEFAEQAIFSISRDGRAAQAVALQVAIADVHQQYTAADSEESGSVLTGLCDLDQIITGLHDSELILIAARPSAGKTALGLTIAHHLIIHGLPVFMSSIEQSRSELARRMVCLHGSIDSQRLRKHMLQADEMQRFGEVVHELEAVATLHVDDSPYQSMLRIAGNARRLRLRSGIRAVFVDYLQLIEPDNHRVSREEQVAAISARLKNLARELAIPVVALAQLNRQTEYRAGPPKLADLRNSGALEQDADTVILLHRPDENSTPREAHVAKQRNGPTGKFLLAFRPEYMRFENHAAGSDDFATPEFSGN